MQHPKSRTCMVAALVRRVAGGAVSELAAGVYKAATDGCARTSFAASRTHSGADFYSSEISPQEQVSLCLVLNLDPRLHRVQCTPTAPGKKRRRPRVTISATRKEGPLQHGVLIRTSTDAGCLSVQNLQLMIWNSSSTAAFLQEHS
jgi:hypothetical protein